MRTNWKPAGLLMAGLALAGCADLDATAGVEPPPAEGRPYPNLATVPRPPTVEPLAGAAGRDRPADGDAGGNFARRPGVACHRSRAGPAAAAAPGRHRRGPRRPTAEAPAAPQPGAAPAPGAPPRRPRRRPRGRAFPAACSWARSWRRASGVRSPTSSARCWKTSATMAKRTNGRIRVVGGRSDEDRQGVVDELVRLGIPAGRIAAAPDRDGGRAPRSTFW